MIVIGGNIFNKVLYVEISCLYKFIIENLVLFFCRFGFIKLFFNIS